MRGWIINLHSEDPSATREEDHDQEPVIYLPETGEPVFEVWFWHSTIERWFVMSMNVDAEMMRQGVVYFHPDEIPDSLRAKMAGLGG